MFEYEKEKIETMDKSFIRYIIIQEEQCPETKKLHLQGYIEFSKTCRATFVKSILGPTTHVEKRRGTQEQAIEYCDKVETSTGWKYEYGKPTRQGERTDLKKLMIEYCNTNQKEFIENNPEDYHKYGRMLKEYKMIYNENEAVTKLKEKHKKEMLNHNQMKMIKHLKEQNDRQITWVHDENGNNGKTWLSKYLIANYGAAYYTNCKSADIAHAYNYEKIIVFDFSRSLEGRVNYTILEMLKNGILFSNKYECKKKIFDTPKIIVMANFDPDKTKLSDDRWDVLEL